jgi:hypothetical protein
MSILKHLPFAKLFSSGKKAASHATKKAAKALGMGSFSGSKSKLKKYETMTHGEKKVYKDILSRINPKALDLMKSPLFKQSQKYISNFLKTSPDQQYKSFEKPIMSQFKQQIVPEIAERFAGMGAMDSSGFQQTMGAAGSNLAERLGMLRESLKSNYQQQQLSAAGMGANMAQMPVQNMQNMINTAFATPSFGYQSIGGQPGFMQGMSGGLGSALGQGLGMLPLLAMM